MCLNNGSIIKYVNQTICPLAITYVILYVDKHHIDCHQGYSVINKIYFKSWQHVK